jgi:hypothetical protein
MNVGQDYFLEKEKIELNISRPFKEVLTKELGPEKASSILDQAWARHKASPGQEPEGLPITILAQRRIEIGLIRHFYNILATELDPLAAANLIGQAVVNDARAAGLQKAAQAGGQTDLLTFSEILPLWSSGGALDMEVMESSKDRLSYKVTRCKYAEMYREMGLVELGFLVSCLRDGAFMEGYAPEVSLKRAKTIMTGDDVCDFLYYLKPNKP